MMTCFSHFSAGVMKRGVQGGGGARQQWEGMGPERQTKAGCEEFVGHLGLYLISGACKEKNHHYRFFQVKYLHVNYAANYVAFCGVV